MSHTARPFRFSAQSTGTPTAAEWRALARRCEDFGYATLHLADHFLGPGEVQARTDHSPQQFAPIPAIMAAADATTRLRVGCRMFCVDYHVPVVLAKELATLDVLTDGRLEIGLGAGWIRAEYEAGGITFRPASERIARLEVFLDLLESFFRAEPVNVDAHGVTVRGMQGLPAPAQSPRPPLMIGGGGKKILRLAAERADIVSLNFANRSGIMGPAKFRTSSGQATEEKVAWVRDSAGDRFTDLELEVGIYFLEVTSRKDAAVDLAGRLGLAAEEVTAMPNVLIGDVDEIVARLEERRATYGLSYISVGAQMAETFAPVVERLAGR